jgi:hypothetical protein
MRINSEQTFQISHEGTKKALGTARYCISFCQTEISAVDCEKIFRLHFKSKQINILLNFSHRSANKLSVSITAP